jgi:FtsZ-binding cell division protein ZapB
MTKLDDKVNEILGIDSEYKPTLETIIKVDNPPVPRVKDNNKADIDNDYDYSRENYYNLIEKGQQAIEGILEIAKESQHPRAYEVAGQLITNVAQTVDKLQDLQKKLKELKDLPKTASPQIKNALFVGSTKELQQMLKANENIKSEKKLPE